MDYNLYRISRFLDFSRLVILRILLLVVAEFEELSCSQFRGVGAAQEKLFKLMVKPLLKYDIFRFIDSYMDNRKLHVLFCFVTNFVELQKMIRTPDWRNPFWTRWTLVFFWLNSQSNPSSTWGDDNVKTACL